MKKIIKQMILKIPYLGRLQQQVDEQGAYLAGHYYSPIPSRKDVAQGIQQATPTHCADIDFRQDDQVRLIEEFADYYKDLPFKEKQDESSCRYFFDQGWFCYSDAIMLYCMIRKYKFKKIIEVGSGYSSAVILDTFDATGNAEHEITFIEPYPERLRSLVDIEKSPTAHIIESRVQETELQLFQSLNPGDLLFIDSSHVVKYRSDLHFLLFNVLPSLKQGVIVHFHDIFYPFEYPDEWLKEGKYWNECYFLQAFLSGNTNWKTILFNNYINQFMGEFIEDKMPLCRNNFGGSIYLEKVG